jgi:putative N6-adenine-specific DNA methylase
MALSQLFLSSARSAPEAPATAAQRLLRLECERILGRQDGVEEGRGGVFVRASSSSAGEPTETTEHALKLDAMRLGLHSRLAQRVLWQVAHGEYRDEQSIYALARSVPWDQWITPTQTLRVDTTAQHAPLKSLNFVTLRVKDAVCDTLRERTGERPSVDTHNPHLSLVLHLTATDATLHVDLSGEPLFKRGWRDARKQAQAVHGEAPLKETLAAQMLAVAGWPTHATLLDPCCGAGTLAIEAAQMACNVAPGLHRSFAFENLRPWQPCLPAWHAMKQDAKAAVHASSTSVHASDIDARMIEIARGNAQRAGVAHAITFAVGDATRLAPPATQEGPGLIVTNPPLGVRLEVHADFAQSLAAHWKREFAGWTAWVLSADPEFERALHLKASQRVPMWNGAIECRLLRLDMVQGAMRASRTEAAAP